MRLAVSARTLLVQAYALRPLYCPARKTLELPGGKMPTPISPTPAVLVVEDDESSGELLSNLLEAEGHRVYQAGDGDQALKLIHRQRFDLALLDVILPG